MALMLKWKSQEMKLVCPFRSEITVKESLSKIYQEFLVAFGERTQRGNARLAALVLGFQFRLRMPHSMAESLTSGVHRMKGLSLS
jgi:hypothetical protein